VDASTLMSKMSLWEERDRAIKQGLDKLRKLSFAPFYGNSGIKAANILAHELQKNNFLSFY